MTHLEKRAAKLLHTLFDPFGYTNKEIRESILRGNIRYAGDEALIGDGEVAEAFALLRDLDAPP